MPAQHDAILMCAKILAKLNPSESPRYPDQGFRSSDARDALRRQVLLVLHFMTHPTAAKGACPLIGTLPAQEKAYFAEPLQSNAAAQQFRTDWGKLKTATGC